MEQHSHTHTHMDTHTLMDTTAVCLYALIFHAHLLTLLEKASVWWHHCLFVCFCVCMSYLYANESGRACWVVRECVCESIGEDGRSHYSRRTDGRGEPWRRTYVALLLKVITTRLQLHPELCLPLSSSSLLFPLYSDEILLFRHTVWMPVWLEVLWHQTHLLYLTEMPNAAVRDDWQAHTPVSATCLSSFHSLMAEPLSLLHVRKMSPSGLSGSQLSLCLNLLLLQS